MTDQPASDLTLADILAAAAEEVDGVQAAVDGELTTWSADGRPFVGWPSMRTAGSMSPTG